MLTLISEGLIELETNKQTYISIRTSIFATIHKQSHRVIGHGHNKGAEAKKLKETEEQ